MHLIAPFLPRKIRSRAARSCPFPLLERGNFHCLTWPLLWLDRRQTVDPKLLRSQKVCERDVFFDPKQNLPGDHADFHHCSAQAHKVKSADADHYATEDGEQNRMLDQSRTLIPATSLKIHHSCRV